MGNNVAVKPLSRKDIRDLARRFRKQFKLEGVFKFPIVQFIEWVLPVVGFDYDIISEKEMKNVYGLTDTQEGMMFMRELSLGNLGIGLPCAMNWVISYCTHRIGLVLQEVKCQNIWILNGKQMHLLGS